MIIKKIIFILLWNSNVLSSFRFNIEKYNTEKGGFLFNKLL